MSSLYTILTSLPVLAVLLLGGAPVLFALLLRAVRLPHVAWYAREGVLDVLLVPALIGLGAGGVACVGRMLSQPAATWASAPDLAAAAVLAVLEAGAFVALVRATAPAQPGPARVPRRGPGDPGPRASADLPRAA